MKRRTFVSGFVLLIAAPETLRAQQKPARIALLGSGAQQSSAIFVDALRDGLRDYGLVDGRDYMLDVRWAEGDYSRFPALAREAAANKSSVIVATTIAAVRAAQRSAPTIPVVMTTINDPVGSGLVASLGRPGGNTTGIANLTENVTPKLLELLHSVLPEARTIAALFNAANPSNLVMLDNIRAHAATSTGATVQGVPLPAGDLDAIFDRFGQRRPDAVIVINDASILDRREQISALAIRHRLPTFSSFPEFTLAGALAAYGPSRIKLYRRSAYYVKKILDGVKPADLPVEQPTHIELSVNLRTAKILGLTIPHSLLLRADEVIQ